MAPDRQIGPASRALRECTRGDCAKTGPNGHSLREAKSMSHRLGNRFIVGATTALALSLGALGVAPPARAAGKGPIKIGVISEESAIVGQSISQGAQLAADDINAHGGVMGRKVVIVTYDDHASAADAVRAFQRAAEQDHAKAVVAPFSSEVALAIEPWAARLHMPTVTPAAASDLISKQVHDKYAQYKYMFEAWMPAPLLAQSICDSADDLLVKPLHIKTVAIMSEDADWTKPLDEGLKSCLPKVGLTVTTEVRFNPDTTDFTPIFNRIEATHPNLIMTGISHVGVQPTVQWHDQQVPIPMAGESYQATTTSFWKDTNGATEGVITADAGAPGVAVTPKTIPFIEAYTKRFGVSPSYAGYATF